MLFFDFLLARDQHYYNTEARRVKQKIRGAIDQKVNNSVPFASTKASTDFSLTHYHIST